MRKKFERSLLGYTPLVIDRLILLIQSHNKDELEEAFSLNSTLLMENIVLHKKLQRLNIGQLPLEEEARLEENSMEFRNGMNIEDNNNIILFNKYKKIFWGYKRSSVENYVNEIKLQHIIKVNELKLRNHKLNSENTFLKDILQRYKLDQIIHDDNMPLELPRFKENFNEFVENLVSETSVTTEELFVETIIEVPRDKDAQQYAGNRLDLSMDQLKKIISYKARRKQLKLKTQVNPKSTQLLTNELDGNKGNTSMMLDKSHITEKVLITGGYGFIGSFVAERFRKEGYEIYIIDDLSNGDKRNCSFKHRSYELSVEDQKCEEIFRSNKFDVVIHLAAQMNAALSIDDPILDTKSNVLGLSNMLLLAQKYKVKKFIYTSVASVYGSNDQLPFDEEMTCKPNSIHGINKWVGELYCRSWQEIYGIETISFRCANVYGPRQNNQVQSDVVTTFMEQIREDKNLTVFGDGSQTRDFIYVGDVAEAIFRASYSSLTGVYNLSTNTERSINELTQIISKLNPNSNITYSNAKAGDIRNSRLDNTKIKQDLDWLPMYTLEEGIEKTYKLFMSYNQIENNKVKEIIKSRFAMPQVIKEGISYIENAMLFLIVWWLSQNQFDASYGFIDFKLFYIIIMGIFYGNRQAIIAVFLSTILLAFLQVENGRELISLLYDTDFFFQISVYLFIGLVVGYTIDRKIFLINSKDRQLDSMVEKYDHLNVIFNETHEVKNQLQQQILNNGDSFGKIYSIIKELESLEPEKIFTSTINVIETIMKSSNVTIYTLNKYGSFLRLVARSKENNENIPKSIKIEDYIYIQEIIQDQSIFINKKLDANLPLMCAPVVNNGKIVAIISLNGINFDNFSLYYQNLFKVIVGLISSALTRAYSFIEATFDQRFITGTPILKKEIFMEILKSKQLSKSKHDVDYVLLSGKPDDRKLEDLSHIISKSLRESDYIGLHPNGSILVLLGNSSLEEANIVLERFRKNNIIMTIANEGSSLE